MTTATEHFDALASALYSGTVKAADLKIMPGETRIGREERAMTILSSMTRLGIVTSGELVGFDRH